MSETIPVHQINTSSRLDPYHDTIVTMRSKGWPYRRIAQWLVDEKAVSISWEAVRQFCLYRNIVKGHPTTPAVPKAQANPHEATIAEPTAAPAPRKFVLDQNAPPTPVHKS